jgi:2-aminoethylphosphonate-pyruvate transaminase
MDGLAALGIRTLLGDARAYSSILASYTMPKHVTYERLHDELKRAGFVIYAGQGSFAGEIFRIAVMGDVTSDDIARLLAEIAKVVS